jgi:hypothetical protein
MKNDRQVRRFFAGRTGAATASPDPGRGALVAEVAGDGALA